MRTATMIIAALAGGAVNGKGMEDAVATDQDEIPFFKAGIRVDHPGDNIEEEDMRVFRAQLQYNGIENFTVVKGPVGSGWAYLGFNNFKDASFAGRIIAWASRDYTVSSSPSHAVFCKNVGGGGYKCIPQFIGGELVHFREPEKDTAFAIVTFKKGIDMDRALSSAEVSTLPDDWYCRPH